MCVCVCVCVCVHALGNLIKLVTKSGTWRLGKSGTVFFIAHAIKSCFFIFSNIGFAMWRR